ncbi:26S proteasome non-ATPase regulatory subunit 9 [Anthonomus grandis grandis]|uniref:26S proteasome non-ATPase regulatory subunit 9 n=1 Tax=Anthonomus grandis grandis TaxID=2921223 RepID=UPI00216633AD|nr:26S proteasome non-ATPase regulatory subunit 9 [Anthonomus grandis grandis]
MKETQESQAQPGSIRAHVLQLMNRKDKIEEEIRELTNILTQNGVGMNEPLVDAEGFPLNTIDIYQVRHARHRIICLQNDHKAIMKQIENGLQGYYSTSSSSDNMDTTPISTEPPKEAVIHKIPFAKVTLVSPGSPADYAGIHVGDEIVEFGSVNSTNFKSVTDIATVVQHSEGAQVNLKLRRGERYLTVGLVPKKWVGRGLLGCNIVAI